MLYFGGYFSFRYISRFFNDDNFNKEDARELIQVIINNYNQGEIFAYNDASDSEYIVYSSYYKFYPKPNVKITAIENDKEKYFETLNQLPKGYIYWFYYPFEFNKTPVKKYLSDWLDKKDILYKYCNNTSCIYKVRL